MGLLVFIGLILLTFWCVLRLVNAAEAWAIRKVNEKSVRYLVENCGRTETEARAVVEKWNEDFGSSPV